MTLRDFLSISLGNFRRMKLRAFLTVSGIIIAIAAFVSMLSFGAGNQKLFHDEYNKLGLFSLIKVYPPRKAEVDDTARAVILNQEAIDKFMEIPGVEMAYPLDNFPVTAKIMDTTLNIDAQTMSENAFKLKLYSYITAGEAFSENDNKKAMVTGQFLKNLNIENPDSILGRELIISVKVSSVDSGLATFARHVGTELKDRIKKIKFDSLMNREYRNRIVRNEINNAMTIFLDGFVNARATVSDTLTICGVLESEGTFHVGINQIIIPLSTALKFDSAGIIDNPANLLRSFKSGMLFLPTGGSSGRTYPQATVSLKPDANHKPVIDSIETMGYQTFSFAEQFKEIRKFFFYFNLALGAIGFMALITASLGIINTMAMAVVERTREIGVLKSLGADEREIRLLFLIESSVFGGIGAAIGIIFGWFLTRIASLVAQFIMKDQGMDSVELFALPLWLIATALIFGFIVSLAAGYYPASRAARIDPVEALRHD